MKITNLRITARDTVTGNRIEITSDGVIDLDTAEFEDHELQSLVQFDEVLSTRGITLTLRVGGLSGSGMTIDVTPGTCSDADRCVGDPSCEFYPVSGACQREGERR